MLLIDDGIFVGDPWTRIADDARDIPAGRPVLLGLARLEREGAALFDSHVALGVVLPPDTAVQAVAPYLARLSLVAVEFPKFRDGRGFSLARALRERYGFAGEIRALGNLLPDQYPFLLSCGFTTVALPDGQEPRRWTEALRQSPVGAAPGSPFPLLRRWAGDDPAKCLQGDQGGSHICGD